MRNRQPFFLAGLVLVLSYTGGCGDPVTLLDGATTASDGHVVDAGPRPDIRTSSDLREQPDHSTPDHLQQQPDRTTPDDHHSSLDPGGDPCDGLQTCPVGGWFCEGNIAVSCLRDDNDCLVETRTDCTELPGGYCSTEGVLHGCRQQTDPCEGVGTCPAGPTQWCEGDVLHTCIPDDDGCAAVTAEETCTNQGKVCDDSGEDAVCAVSDRSVISAQIQTVRDAIDDAGSLPVSGDWDIDNALVTYVKAPLGADSGGIVIQGEPLGPALFIVHEDPVDTFVVGDEITITLHQADLDQQRHVATELGWLDFTSFDNDVSFLIQDGNNVDLVTELESYEFELMTLEATVRGPFNSAGSGFVDALIDTAIVIGSQDLRLRIPTSLSTTLLGGQADLIDCEVTIGPTPLWRYLGRAQPLAMVEVEIQVTCP